MENKIEPQLSELASDVLKGLNSSPKRLSSKYFYDDAGSKIFQEIMEMPEYYLTNAEHEILEKQSIDIAEALNFGNEFSIIELGAGDGKKTFELLQHLLEFKYNIHYRPVDISGQAIKMLEKDLNKRLPDLHIQPLIGDYFKVMRKLPKREKPALFLFLGSNIGNYENENAIALLKKFGNFLQPGDKILVGFDLVKNPKIILSAYDDSAGITRRFNLNLLVRLNRELGMNFELDEFEFFPYYNPNNGELRSSIVSLNHQVIYSEILDQSFHFDANELIHTELSKKYTLGDIESYANSSGFRLVKNFLDKKNLFADSLWEKL